MWKICAFESGSWWKSCGKTNYFRERLPGIIEDIGQAGTNGNCRVTPRANPCKRHKNKVEYCLTLFLLIVANLTKYLNDKNGIFSLFAVPLLGKKMDCLLDIIQIL